MGGLPPQLVGSSISSLYRYECTGTYSVLWLDSNRQYFVIQIIPVLLPGSSFTWLLCPFNFTSSMGRGGCVCVCVCVCVDVC